MRSYALVALLASIALPHAAQAGEATLAVKVKQHQRYFTGAHAALTTGGVAPRLKYKSTTAGIAAGLGMSHTWAHGTVTENGMEHEVKLRPGNSYVLGAGVGIGHVTGTYFAPKGLRGTGEITESFNKSKVMALESSIGIPLLLPLVELERPTKSALPLGAAKKSVMLSRVEEGKQLADEAAAKLGSDPAGARAALHRLELLHSEIAQEKQGLNKLRAQQRAIEKYNAKITGATQ